MKVRYATINNPTIQAVLSEMYRFGNERDAKEQLKVLERHFIHSRQQIRNDAHPSVHLWIKGYGVIEGDEVQGIIGHFAIITYKKRDEWFVLYATKVPTEAALHPQRAQIKRDNPNWGHPVLRAIRKKKIYATLAEAEAELTLLHQQFPRVSIPNPGKLYIMIYCSNRPPKERMVKHKLEITVAPEGGGYFIDCKENTRKLPPKKPVGKMEAEPPVPQGKFTAKVVLAKRKNRPEPKKPA